MTALLSRLFIKNYRDTKNPAVRSAYGTMVSIIGILLNLLLFMGKFFVGFLFGAVAIYADAFNNLSDAGSQIVSLVCFRIAAKPADRDHPYGHARIEYLASVIVSLLVLLIAYELFTESLSKLFLPSAESAFGILTVIVLTVSVLVKLWLYLFNRTVAKKIDSTVMRATVADSLSDAAATGAVLVAVIVGRFVTLPFSLDAVMGIAISVLICIAGIKILLEAKNAILGEGPTEEIVKSIEKTVNQYPESLGIHDMLVKGDFKRNWLCTFIPYKAEEGRLTFTPSPVKKTAKVRAAGGSSMWLLNTQNFAGKEEITFNGMSIPENYKGNYRISASTIISMTTQEYTYTCIPNVQKSADGSIKRKKGKSKGKKRR
jgi:cation diffusion facilitator family transporter